MIPPILFLSILVAATLLLLILQLIIDRTRQRKLIALAREWRMHFARDDRFNLAPRVAERLSLAGAADVRIVDLIYGSEQGLRRYIFSAHYTKGVVRWKRRVSCVASLSENKDVWSPLRVAQKTASLVERYREVGETNPGNT